MYKLYTLYFNLTIKKLLLNFCKTNQAKTLATLQVFSGAERKRRPLLASDRIKHKRPSSLLLQGARGGLEISECLCSDIWNIYLQKYNPKDFGTWRTNAIPPMQCLKNLYFTYPHKIITNFNPSSTALRKVTSIKSHAAAAWSYIYNECVLFWKDVVLV